MTLHESAAELLRDGAAYIEKHGHTKRVLMDGVGRVCLIGAMYSIQAVEGGSSDIKGKIYDLAQGAVRTVVGDDPSHWNDEDERTPDEVCAAMREAADQLERSAPKERLYC